MSFANLSTSCSDAMRIFAEMDVIELRNKVKKLELAAYHEKLPSLSVVMTAFNKNAQDEEGNYIQCECYDCISNDRVDENDMTDATCTFLPRWNELLKRVNASVETGEVMPKFVTQNHVESSCALFTIDDTLWYNDISSWGRPLSSLNSPRRKVWDTIVEEAIFPVDNGWQSHCNEGVSECLGNCRFGDELYHPGTWKTYDGSKCQCIRCRCGLWVPQEHKEAFGGTCGTCAAVIHIQKFRNHESV